MVSLSPNPSERFYLLDGMGVNFAGCISECTEDPNKKIRKPYTITKSRESWSDQEHDKFLEAIQLFDRDWKKIEVFVGSKTVIQIRSHAQKYFLKIQKTGTSEHVPPPRPKRKAAHPYPQKAAKAAAPVLSQVAGPIHSSSLEPGYIYRPDSSSVLGNPVSGLNFSSWSYDPMVPVNCAQPNRDDAVLAAQKMNYTCGSSSSNESTTRTWRVGEIVDKEDEGVPLRVMPDFAQVYNFIGSIFDPNSGEQLQRLKQMDPINLETAVLLMTNLSINLTSPEFENHRHLLACYDADDEWPKSDDSLSNMDGW